MLKTWVALGRGVDRANKESPDHQPGAQPLLLLSYDRYGIKARMRRMWDGGSLF